MSLPAYDIFCTDCSYEGYKNSRAVYQFIDGRDAFDDPMFDEAWCNSCQRVVSVATRYSESYLQGEIERLTSYINEIDNPWIFEKISRFLSSKSKQEYLDHRQYLIDKIELFRKKIAYFAENPFPERCMSCGSTNVVLVDLPDGRDYEPKPIGIKHCCGGEIVAKTGAWIHFSGGPVVVYDRNGHILSDEREPEEKPILTEEAAVKCFIEGHNTRWLADFYCMLSEDAIYFSEWASEEKIGRIEIMDYLKSKMVEIENASNYLWAVLGKSNEKLCAAILRNEETTPIAIVFLTLSEQNKINRVDVLKPQMEIEIINGEDITTIIED